MTDLKLPWCCNRPEACMWVSSGDNNDCHDGGDSTSVSSARAASAASQPEKSAGLGYACANSSGGRPRASSCGSASKLMSSPAAILLILACIHIAQALTVLTSGTVLWAVQAEVLHKWTSFC